MMKLWRYIYFLLLLILSLIIIAIFQLPDKNLHIIACDVGQGDAILITYKNIQILTDGGPDNKVLNCLGKHIPFWDRRIELVISTHPDLDHLAGIVEVVKRYDVNKILINSINPGTPIYRLLENGIGSKGVKVINPQEGQSIGMDLIYLDILNPNNELLNRLGIKDETNKLSKYSIGKETNLYSIVYRLSFGKFKALMLGDIPPEVSDNLSSNYQLGTVNYIKIPHHGSSNGLTQNLLEKIASNHNLVTYAVISVGAKNDWGFPAEPILKMLKDSNINILRTDEMGDVEVITDGRKYWLKK